jgi:glycosyltransferase involved in cell wall biosynthesis
MRIAFYAPLKPPDHPVPSGDRRMARLLMAALKAAGHEPMLAARLRSRDGSGDRRRQARLRALGTKLADRYLRRVAARPDLRPDLWLTYHVYYKAPDWIGPRVASALGIPYVVAEASLAEKRRSGEWQIGHRATTEAIRRADRVIGLNSADREGVLPALTRPEHWTALLPFLDTAPFDTMLAGRRAARARVAERARLETALPWLVTVAMMRDDVKLESYRLLGAALARCLDRPFQLVVAGDGPAQEQVKAALKPIGSRVRYLGRLEESEVPELLVASDLYVWPAIGEAYGLAILEAQAAGLPVVAGRTGGVGDIVSDGVTGILVPVGDVGAFSAATAVLIDDETRRARMGSAARRKIAASHDLAAASRRLDAVLRDLLAAPAR